MTGIKDNQIMICTLGMRASGIILAEQRKIQSPQLARRIGIFIRIQFI
jgi:hypothetical protein